MTTEKKVLIISAILTIILLGGGIVLVTKGSGGPAQVTTSQNAKASIDQTSYDWGTIPYQGGNKTKDFIIKNTGTDTLKLANIKTSCHCTKAQVTIDGKTSPYFGMAGVSGWVGEILPGKEAKLTVIFDPLYHGLNGLGPIERLVDVETNDISNPKIEFSLKGTVIK